MTEKELKRLNRLEILELLLEQSKLNEDLKQELDELKKQNDAANSVGRLEEMIVQMNSALDSVGNITRNLQKSPTEEHRSEKKDQKNKENASEQEKTVVTNKNLYGRIMYFFWQNEDSLSLLPVDLQNDIKIKLRGIFNDKK